MVILWLAETANVVTVKLADVWPAGTLTMPSELVQLMNYSWQA